MVGALKLDVLGTRDVRGEIPAVVDPNPALVNPMEDERRNTNGGQDVADVEVAQPGHHLPGAAGTCGEALHVAEPPPVGLVLRPAGGHPPGDRVAVVLPPTPETAAVFFGTWKLGAILLSMSVLYGDEGIAHRLRDSEPKLLVTDADNASRFEGRSEARVLELDVAALARESDRFQTLDTAADDPAQLYYTSGTTGLAKGIVHAHRYILAHNEFVHCHDVRPGERFLTVRRRCHGVPGAGEVQRYQPAYLRIVIHHQNRFRHRTKAPLLILAAWRPLISSAVALIVHRRSPSLLSDKKKPGGKPPGMPPPAPPPPPPRPAEE